jgi:hypothetical protein
LAVVAGNRHAHAALHVKVDAIHGKGGGEGGAQRRGGLDGVSPPTARRAAARRTRRQPRRATLSRPLTAPAQPHAHLHNQLVAALMAERVVDLLEPVEVDQQQRHRRVGTGTRHERLLDALGEQDAVGQPGERVVMRVVDRALAFDHQQAPVAPGDGGEQPGEEQPRQEHTGVRTRVTDSRFCRSCSAARARSCLPRLHREPAAPSRRTPDPSHRRRSAAPRRCRRGRSRRRAGRRLKETL